jgi:hypothetical protein
VIDRQLRLPPEAVLTEVLCGMSFPAGGKRNVGEGR